MFPFEVKDFKAAHEMLHVIIDTSIYRQDPKRGKAAFRAVTRLCEGRKITLYVPEYVKGEFVSQQKAEVEKEIQSIITAVKSITRRSQDKRLVDFSEGVGKAAEKILPKAAILTTEEFTRWAKKCNAVTGKLRPEHAARVMKDYFDGAPPFSSVKHRNDIPDSFIWQAVRDVASKRKKVFFIANDGELFKAANSLSNVTAYKTLDEFVESPEFQKAIEELTTEAMSRNVSRAIRLFPKNMTSLQSMVESDVVDALANRTLRDSRIPDDNGEATITLVGIPEDLTFDFDNADFYGGSEIGIPFSTTIECQLNYAIYKADYYLLDPDKMDRISITELNDHYYDADETYDVDVVGILSVGLETKVLENPRATEADVEEAILSGLHDVEITDASLASTEDNVR
jgi:rRNA-processing protein FCF1